MRAPLVCCTLASLSCSPTPPPTSDPCAPYFKKEDSYGYCVTQRVASFKRIEDAAAACEYTSGRWQWECRTAWMEQHVSNTTVPTGMLLEFCRSDDCRLLVLDSHPETDLLLQWAECEKAGRYGSDCRGHAGQRWFLGLPSTAEIGRIAAVSTEWPELQSEVIGMAIGCGSEGNCGQTPKPDVCEISLARVRTNRATCRGTQLQVAPDGKPQPPPPK